MLTTTKKKRSKARSSHKTDQTLSTQGTVVPVVGIGASAGGIEAITQLFDKMPTDTGFAFTIIMHFDPNQESALVSILNKINSMQVIEMRNGMELEPNKIYVSPAKADPVISPSGKIKLIPRGTAAATLRLPIDLFFNSLAENRKNKAIGVVLSGTASDGTLGLNAIKAEGGITIAQKCSSARYESMPRSAIQSGAVDLILTPKQMSSELAVIAANPYVKDQIKNNSKSHNDFDYEEIPSKMEDALVKIMHALYKVTNLDFTNYKSGTLQRRIKRRMLLHKLESLDSYAQYVTKHIAEAKSLARDFLITTSCFFRDNDVFASLKETVLPQLSKNDSVRVWVPGCASGQEAYSLAITLIEFFEKKKKPMQIRVFATDVSESSLQLARIGFYPSNITQHVSKKRLDRFFEKIDGGYRVTKDLRSMCIFSYHDIIRDPPFAKIDLISCRNLLIYFNSELQKQVISTLHYSLNLPGFLLLGCSESLLGSGNLFGFVDKKNRIYYKKPLVHTTLLKQFSFNPLANKTNKKSIAKKVKREELGRVKKIKARKHSAKPYSLPNYSDSQIPTQQNFKNLMARFETAEEELVASNEELQSSNEELQHANEELETTKEELQSSNEELTTVNDELMIRNTEVTELNKALRNLLVCIDIPIVLLDENKIISHFTPMASKILSLIPSDVGRPISDIKPKLKSINLDEILNQVINKMTIVEMEIQDTEDTWHKLVVRPYQSNVHELHGNKLDGVVLALFNIDDLKSANQTIQKTRDDALAVITNFPLPLLVIDGHLRILRANEAFYKSFKITPQEAQNESIAKVCNGLWNFPALIKRLKIAISKNVDFKEFETEHTFPDSDKFLLFSITPIYLSDGTNGVVLAIQDITTRKQEEYKKLYDKLALAIEAGQIGTWEYDPKLDVFSWDERVNEIWGIDYKTQKGDYFSWINEIHPQDKREINAKFQRFIAKETQLDAEFRIVRPSGEVRWVHIKAIAVHHKKNPDVIGVTWDITDETLLAQELLQERKKLIRSLKERDQVNEELERFAYMASHDLKAPLRGIESLTDWIEGDPENKLTADSKENFDLLRSRVKRMSNLIEGILLYTRAGRVDSDITEVSVKELLDEIIDNVNPPPTFTINYAKNLPTFKTAKVPLSQVFSNLICNGIKYSKPDGKIEIGYKDRGQFYEFYVSDNGPGIKPIYHQRIFEMFQSLQSRDKVEGTGIGLSIVKKIVELNHGRVTVESDVGKGATFRFTWPKVLGQPYENK